MARITNQVTATEPEVPVISVWSRVEETLDNACTTVSEATGLISDALRLSREMLKPTIIEARADTLFTLIDNVEECLAKGMDMHTAKRYLQYGI